MAVLKTFSDSPRLLVELTVSPAEVSAASVEEQEFDCAKATPDMAFVVTPRVAGANGLNGCAVGAAFCTAAGKLTVQLINPTAAPIVPKASQVWQVTGL